jgi:hypothetical protein
VRDDDPTAGRFYISEFDRLLSKNAPPPVLTDAPPPSPFVVKTIMGATMLLWVVYFAFG